MVSTSSIQSNGNLGYNLEDIKSKKKNNNPQQNINTELNFSQNKTLETSVENIDNTNKIKESKINPRSVSFEHSNIRTTENNNMASRPYTSGIASPRTLEQRGRFQASAQAVSTKLAEISSAIESSPHKTMLTQKLSEATQAYEKALAMRPPNPALVALYSSLLDKISTSITNGASGDEIAKTFDDFNKIVEGVKSNKNGRGTRESRQETNKLIKDFIGEEAFFALRGLSRGKTGKQEGAQNQNSGEMGIRSFSSTSNQNGNYFNLEDESSAETVGQSDNPSTDSEGDVIDMLADGLESAEAAGVPIPVTTEDEMKQIRAMSADDVRQAIDSIPNLRENLKQFQVLNRQLMQDQIRLVNYETEDLISVSTSQDNPETVMNERVNQVIAEADKLEGELNLEMENGEDVSQLLKRFRQIIVDLDIDLRDNARKSNESSFISNSNQAYMRDMKLRSESIDKVKSEINEIYKELQQVRLNKDNNQLKLLSF